MPLGQKYIFLSLGLAMLFLNGCALAGTTAATEVSTGRTPGNICPVTEPVLLTPPDDAAVMGTPAPGRYFINEDRSIMAAAPWSENTKNRWRAGENGNKVGWFRPEGAKMEITGRRLDAAAAPMQAQVPCCYPTRFQATGLNFSSGGCWEISARSLDHTLTFVVEVDD